MLALDPHLNTCTLCNNMYTGQASDVQKYAEDVWQLEKELAAISVFDIDRKKDRQKYYNEMTLGQLQALIDQNQLRGSSNTINMSSILGGKPASTRVIVAVPDYFSKIGGIIRRASAETQASYAVWSVLQPVASKAGSPFNQAGRDWKSCVDGTTKDLEYVTSTLYVDKYFSAAEKKRVVGLLKIFEEALEVLLDGNVWMDSVTKKRAKEKAHAIVGNVVIENLVGKPQALDNKYENLKITDDPSVNLINVLTFKALSTKKNIVQSETENKEDMPSELDVNAFYNPLENQITILAGILEKPLYDESYPASVIFGSIGYIIGHEYMHGFDSSGRNFDKDGNMINWWSK